MKKILTSMSVLILMIFISALLFGCASTKIKHLSGTEFVEKSKGIYPMNSFTWTDYIGEGSGRIYLEYGYPAFIGGGSRVTVYWTETSDLPLDFSIKLRNGAFPWEPNSKLVLPEELKAELEDMNNPLNWIELKE